MSLSLTHLTQKHNKKKVLMLKVKNNMKNYLKILLIQQILAKIFLKFFQKSLVARFQSETTQSKFFVSFKHNLEPF